MDFRNVAHDKTVAQEKKKKHGAVSDAVPHVQPGKKPKKGKRTAVTAAHAAPAEDDHASAAGGASSQEASPLPVQSAPAEPPPELEGALVVLAQLKDLAFHANAHQGRLAELMLTVEEKLKQKELATVIGDIYSAQADLHTRLTDFVTRYSAECDRLQA
jgi:hypothetical protein